MRRRCYTPTDNSYRYAGGRGATVYGPWRRSFAAFLEHMGPKPSPSHSIDRFPDAHGSYKPGNVRWATKAEQSRNRPGFNRLIVHGGRAACAAEWQQITGIPANTIRTRIDRFGWPVAAALGYATPPSQARRATPRLPAVGAVARNRSSGFYGVSWHRASRKWQARLTFAGRTYYLGCHRQKAAAIAAVRAKLAEIGGGRHAS